ncbi:MAG: hypothetical protein COX77_00560 [Candidatus Komeilibacteria bacterium CG_4_10_14_0_2_um_filter_37_10]|uniref:Multidrug ABC transporter substrate-binding protein n=1 Tax=Candidatus Komeilibacteria bacterium CG_4_10_14_0_2_um_filter_37_10 TaxID=1974470 RepID=A0A2M7VG90_9BACT|nr:MAG: hypothetical protein COX77_00560 [Candidatus Komeilibacteria bacterium CG_4_10_14_0_2_um_filter_37_10]PJA92714.1 MAG: hypothetical protein CO133_01685 [Candidatus Komeilibacteria bacterium CG_4_9_14_3_um_filter_37_5]
MGLFLFRLAWDNLRRNKWRSFLTMLGVIIGVAGVIMIIAVGAGAQSMILGEITKVGSSLIGILPGASDDNGPPAQVMGINVTTFVNDDLQKLINDPYMLSYTCASGYVRGMATAQVFEEKKDVFFLGVENCLPELENFSVQSGRFFNEVENKEGSAVVVLGSEVAEEIFPNQDPLNQIIKIKKRPFKIIGVVEKRGTSFFTNQDNQVYLPLLTAQRSLLGINYLNFARIKLLNEADIEHGVEFIKQKMRELHNIDGPEQDDFSVRNQAQALAILQTVTDGIRLFLAAMAAISLIVGGIGIMNIMLASVTERTREIGLRKAVGATKQVVIWQFLMEAILVTLVGAIAGLVLGLMMAWIIALVVQNLGYAWQFIVNWQYLLVSAGIAIFIGLFFGIYPAAQAAKLDPVESLRYE